MWILSFLPNWIFYGILLVGVLGLTVTYFLRLIPIPAIYMYKTPIQLVSIVLIAFGVYMSGAISNEEAWQARVKELEVKLAAAEAEGAKETVKIVEKVVTQQRIIREKGEEVIRYVDREVVKFDTRFAAGGECEIPKEFIKSLNIAAQSSQSGTESKK